MEIRVSSQFKERGRKAITSVAIFIVVYILLLIAALGFVIVCGFVGIGIIGLRVNFLTIGIGGGVIGLGLIVLIFLIKFVFKRTKNDTKGWIELDKKSEPRLFSFLEQTAQDAGSPLPKKVYLSHDVNASVFYNSSFWSMFLPVKKNLHIGYGLVNATTVQEFKATLAHEFGHFSQRSMKVGSYVYQVNKVIYNLLYENDSFNSGAKTWAEFNWFFAIFVSLASWIIRGIQWILQKLYNSVNLSHKALSREMEFYADAVGAKVAGSEALINLLLRLDIADNALNKVFSFYDGKIADNFKSKNVFAEQKEVLDFWVNENKYPFQNGFPKLSLSEINKYNKSKLVVKDQWSSHPSTEDRIRALEDLGVAVQEVDYRPARELFMDPVEIEKRISSNLFQDIPYSIIPETLSIADFRNQFEENEKENWFNPLYNGYYDIHNPLQVNLDSIYDGVTFNELFIDEKVNLIYEYQGLEQDLHTLKSIADRSFSVNSFDYDGQRYSYKEAEELITRLDGEFGKVKEDIKENDQKIFSYFYSLAIQTGEENTLKEKYRGFLDQDKYYDSNLELREAIYNASNFILTETPLSVINKNFVELSSLEIKLKFELRKIIEHPFLKSDILEEKLKKYQQYIENKEEYFDGKAYKDDILQLLWEVIDDFGFLNNRLYYLTKKDLLSFQASLIRN